MMSKEQLVQALVRARRNGRDTRSILAAAARGQELAVIDKYNAGTKVSASPIDVDWKAQAIQVCDALETSVIAHIESLSSQFADETKLNEFIAKNWATIFHSNVNRVVSMKETYGD